MKKKSKNLLVICITLLIIGVSIIVEAGVPVLRLRAGGFDTNASLCPSGYYLDGDGTCNNINTTIDYRLTSIYYNATQVAIIKGTIDSGIIAYTQHQDGNYDGITFNFSEAAGSPGLDIRINFTNVEDFNRGVIRYKTSSLSGDYPIIQMWNYNGSIWEDYPPFALSMSFATITQPVFNSAEYLSNGVAQMRIYKESNGNTQNHYYIDWVAISSGPGTPSGQEVDPYSWHRGNQIGETGSFNTTGNITSSGWGFFTTLGSLFNKVSRIWAKDARIDNATITNLTIIGDFSANVTNNIYDKRTATIIIAANNSKNKEGADYICDGINDEVEISNAIGNLTNGGKIVLLEGTFNIMATIYLNRNNLTLTGMGASTILSVSDLPSISRTIWIIANNTEVSNLKIDNQGNNDYAIGTMSVLQTKIQDNILLNNRIGIIFEGDSAETVIKGNVIDTCSSSCLDITRGATANEAQIKDNIILNSAYGGILLGSNLGKDLIISGNIIKFTDIGIDFAGNSSSIFGNKILGSITNSIRLASTSGKNVVFGNLLDNAILNEGVENTIFGNIGTITDSGTGTVLSTASEEGTLQSGTEQNVTLSPSGVDTVKHSTIMSYFEKEIITSENITAEFYCNSTNCYNISSFLTSTSATEYSSGGTISGTLNITQNLNVTQNITATYGFFNYLGSVLKKITNIFATNIQATNMTTTNITVSDKICLTDSCSAKIYHNGTGIVIKS